MDLEAARRYERIRIVLRVITFACLLVYAGAWAALAGPAADRLGELTDSRWVGLGLYGAVFLVGFELLMLPLAYYSEFGVEHAFGLSTRNLRAWLVHTAKEWLVGLVLGAVMLAGFYAALWYGGRAWWLWVWAGWLALTVGLARLFPVLILPLFYKSAPIEREPLRERLLRLAEGAGVRIDGLFRLDVSKETRKANAMLAGLGATRRVYLSDTLLDAFTDEQIGVVFAHELAHHVYRHIPKSIALSAASGTLLVAAVAVALGPYAGPDRAIWPAGVTALPYAVLSAGAVSALLSPLGNAISRRFERQCDAAALARTGDPQAYREAFRKLGEMNLADPDPPRWVEVLFHDHPALSRRIAMAADREAVGGSVGGADAATNDLDRSEAV